MAGQTSTRESGRGHRQVVEHDPDLATEHVEQHGDALAVGYSVEQAEVAGEDSVDDPDLVAHREPGPGFEADESALVLAPPQTIDDAVSQNRRLVAVANQAAHSDGRLDRPPALRRHVDRDEQIART